MQTTGAGTWSWGRIAILVVAVLELINWLFYLPSLFTHPLSDIPTQGWQGALMLAILLVFPVLAAIGGVLAIRGQRLRLAAILVSIQPFVWLLTVIAFAIGVARHGF